MNELERDFNAVEQAFK